MSLNDFIIDHGYNDNRYLNTAYKRFLQSEVNTLIDESEIERWEIYNMITDELVKFGYLTEFDELKYRITERETPNDVILDILSKITEPPIIIITLFHMVEKYMDEDFKHYACTRRKETWESFMEILAKDEKSFWKYFNSLTN